MKYLKEQQHKPSVRKAKSRPWTEQRFCDPSRCETDAAMEYLKVWVVFCVSRLRAWPGAAGEETHDGSKQCQGGSSAIG